MALLLFWPQEAGAGALERDERAAQAAPPTSLAETVERFVPGFVPDGSFGNARLLKGEHKVISRNVMAGVTYALVAFSERSTDVDAYVMVQRLSGLEKVAQDLAADGYPVVLWRATESMVVEFHVVQAGVGGDIGWAILQDPVGWAQARLAQDEVEARWLALSARAFARWHEAGRATEWAVAGPQLIEWTVPVKAGRCMGIGAVGSASVLGLDLQLLDESAYERSRDTRPGPDAAVMTCTSRDMSVLVRAAVTAGNGRLKFFQVERGF
ncbi:MAG: hypothetical protein HQ461_07485 [Deltaproteobacteria bacterium]|nr:hypothetical protein [Deltaproteobacteria bacterium]